MVFLLLQEMACISMFMSGNPREQKYPFHYMESAITTYLQSCKYALFYCEMIIVKKISLLGTWMWRNVIMLYFFPLCILSLFHIDIKKSYKELKIHVLRAATLAIFIVFENGSIELVVLYVWNSEMNLISIIIILFSSTFRNPLYATRATLVSTEALKSRKMYNEAALQFIKLTSEVMCHMI